jgi:hypothetical protein
MSSPKGSGVVVWAAKTLARFPFASTTRQPVFIIGCARSGTSVLKRALGRHPEIDAYPSEANELWHPTSYPWSTSAARTSPLWHDPEAFIADSLAHWPRGHGTYIRRVFAFHQRLVGRPVFLNKSSMINFMLPRVNQLFPDARFIHIVRDGRAVALSYAHKEHAKMVADEALYRRTGLWCERGALVEHMAQFWVSTLAAIDKARSDLSWDADARYHQCRYEDFCDHPQLVLDHILRFLTIAPARLEPGEDVRNMNYKFRQQLAPETLSRINHIMAGTLTRLDYPLDADRALG